jgi:hypothetical protein
MLLNDTRKLGTSIVSARRISLSAFEGITLETAFALVIVVIIIPSAVAAAVF